MINENGKEVEEQSASDLAKQIKMAYITVSIENIKAVHLSLVHLMGQLFDRAEKIVDQGTFKKWIKDNFQIRYKEVKILMNLYRDTTSRMQEAKKECECSGDISPLHHTPDGKPKLSLVT